MKHIPLLSALSLLLCPLSAALAQNAPQPPAPTAFFEGDGRDNTPARAPRAGNPAQGTGRAGDAQGNTAANALDIAAKIVAGARAQVGVIKYDAAYVTMPYPGGDVPGHRGLCADVVVRALRNAGYDLQYLIHEDRLLNLQFYPRTMGWGRRGADPNSDHRVVPNQMFFFQRFGTPLPLDVNEETLEQWQPGDLVYWNTGSPLLHAGVVSDTLDDQGCPFVIHMMDDDCVESDDLLTWPIIGHFRFPAKTPVPTMQDVAGQNAHGQDAPEDLTARQ